MDKQTARAALSAKLAKVLKRYDRAVGRVLKATREDLDLTQEDVAEQLGWTRNQVANAEVGRRRVSTGELLLFAKVFKMEPETLIGRIKQWLR